MELLEPREAKIIERGRGPEISGTRITVFDVMDYLKHERHLVKTSRFVTREQNG